MLLAIVTILAVGFLRGQFFQPDLEIMVEAGFIVIK